jgi:hypothetical protein
MPLSTEADIAAAQLVRDWMAERVDQVLAAMRRNHIDTHDQVAVDFVVAAARMSAEAVMSANGYNVGRALAHMDRWIADERRRANDARPA